MNSNAEQFFIDSESEKIVQKALSDLQKDRVVIVIAHRLSTIRQADCIYVLEKGKIVEQGTHEQLLADSGVYSNLWKVQTGM